MRRIAATVGPSLGAVLLCAPVGAVLLCAPVATADPQDLMPWCSGDQTPVDDNCRPMAHQEFTHGSGLDPDLPGGLDPGNPAVLP
ncbi:hypothetical protein MHAS_03408 [Mycolicibacterium hassiacum DSM 44199]|uniref:hypothetical protein n=1 Tax=Mycolicibacterium hassiacum TaxID=46351 RepID=UPI000B2F921F|nr:hypothetical protein [Mycolicibacterium hassiacum]MDA4084860.1 hypothetical protein [Mycolicibacterium hassiacum DSM 44199]VCT91690.1 hypothetical protein MHAS_03408 [Mycolicibacterium hassiacum DSM 44199]